MADLKQERRNCSSRLTGPFWGVCDCGLNCDSSGVPVPAQTEPPREFWTLLHEWADTTDEERRDAIEHRFGELFALAAAGVKEDQRG